MINTFTNSVKTTSYVTLVRKLLLIFQRGLFYKLYQLGIIKTPAKPIVITHSITNLCNSHCITCNIWKYGRDRFNEELKLSEIEQVFKSIGEIFFYNISGGEPYLREDLVQIVEVALDHLKPSIIHIPTNGIAVDMIEKRTREILTILEGKEVILTIKISLDGVGAWHDRIRGVHGNFEQALSTYKRLKELQKKYQNLQVGFNTILSKYNAKHFPELAFYVFKNLKPDSYVFEVAELRSELFNEDFDITPDAETYDKLAEIFIKLSLENLKNFGHEHDKVASLYTEISRLSYYKLVSRILHEQRQIIPCYAGLSSAHISPYGDVWPCCILAYKKCMGRLKDYSYNFMKLWQSERANEIRQFIKKGLCWCPMANQMYTNMLYNIPTMLKILVDISRVTLYRWISYHWSRITS